METSIDTDSDHVNLYGDISSRLAHAKSYYLFGACSSGHALYDCIDYGRGRRNGWKVV